MEVGHQYNNIIVHNPIPYRLRGHRPYTKMLILSTGAGRAVLKLASAQLRTSSRIGLTGIKGISTANSTHERVPADLAGLLPTLEELGLGSGDNGKSTCRILPE